MSRRQPIEIDYAAAAGRPLLASLRRWLPRAVAEVPTQLRSLSIAMVGDATMSRLHLQFLHVPGTTDVITFELEHDAHGRPTAGEVVVCVPEARRQAAKRGVKVEHELLLYALHGVLHLSGYDDLEPAAHRRMHRAEDRVLTKIGIGAIFGRGATGSRRTTAGGRLKDGTRR
jgi:rRNA maturation RNase YbeY